MSTLGSRLRKLEAIVGDPTGERQRRIAQGLCPDCGYEHGYLPTNGGAWRCVGCGNRFQLRPGPACNQACPLDGERRGCNALQRPMRLGVDTRHTPEQVAWLHERRAQRASVDLAESMAPEHLDIVRRWLKEHGDDLQERARRGMSWYDLIERLGLPALVRAFLVQVAHHVKTNLSVSLAQEVAAAYLAHQDAWPEIACAGCGYLLPARIQLGPDDASTVLGSVRGSACPICGLDNQPKGRGAVLCR